MNRNGDVERRETKGSSTLKIEGSSRKVDMWVWHSAEKDLGQEVHYLYLYKEKVIAPGRANTLRGREKQKRAEALRMLTLRRAREEPGQQRQSEEGK